MYVFSIKSAVLGAMQHAMTKSNEFGLDVRHNYLVFASFLALISGALAIIVFIDDQSWYASQGNGPYSLFLGSFYCNTLLLWTRKIIRACV
jgi:hypothetical protein